MPTPRRTSLQPRSTRRPTALTPRTPRDTGDTGDTEDTEDTEHTEHTEHAEDGPVEELDALAQWTAWAHGSHTQEAEASEDGPLAEEMDTAGAAQSGRGWDGSWDADAVGGASPFPTLDDEPSGAETWPDHDLVASVTDEDVQDGPGESDGEPASAAMLDDTEPGSGFVRLSDASSWSLADDDAGSGGIPVHDGVPRPYGPGSAYAPADGIAPPGYAIKGQESMMLFYPKGGRFYSRVVADVYFDTEESAERAGFTRFDRRASSAHVSLRPENLR